jgi:hypothetical protein
MKERLLKSCWASVLAALCACTPTIELGDGGGGGDGSLDGDVEDSGSPDGSTTPTCRRVDLIIAVDDSSSMREEKDALANDVFPAFAGALLDIGGGLDDYRIGVLDSCPQPAGYHTRGLDGPCNFASGEVWMDSSDPDLEAEFACVGNIDSSDAQCSGDNDDEQPASAAAASMEEPVLSGVNDGFLRNDALLVVIAITDEDEQPVPSESPEQVYERLVAAKGGDVSRMVFLGIGGASDCDGLYGHAEDASTLQAVTDLFIDQGHGVFWDLCDGALEDGLGEAMAVIEHACDAWVY